MVHFTGLMSSVFPLIFWNKWQLNYTPWWHREKIRSHCNRPGSWNWWRLLTTSSSYWWFISAASEIFTKLKFLLASPQSCLDLHLHITLYATTCAHCCQCVVVCSWDSVVPPSDSASVWISVLSQSLCRVEVTNTGIVLLYLLMKRFKPTLWNWLKCPSFILTHL